MLKNLKSILLILLILIIFGFICFVIYVLIDFRNDYLCSTTTDINYFNEHNCIRYFERGERNE